MNWPPSQPCVSAQAVDCFQVADWSREIGWDIEYQQLGRGNFNAWFSAAACQGLRLTNQFCSRGLVISGSPPQDMVAVVLPSGVDPLGVYEGARLHPNDAIILCSGDGRVLRSPNGFRACTVSIPRPSLEAALWHHAHCELPIVLPDSRSLTFSSERVEKLGATIRALAGGELGALERAAKVELEDRILEELATGLCEKHGDLKQHRVRRNRTEYVRRAFDYIEARSRNELPISQVAVHAGCTTRTLELAFRDVLGVSPKEYILSRRLNQVRQCLLKEGRETGTLTELALEHGLFHLGRFSLYYKTLFGELPSETVRRSQ